MLRQHILRIEIRLVNTLERRHCLALVFVESGTDDIAVLDRDVGLGGILDPGQGVLHPGFVVTLVMTRNQYCVSEGVG